MKDKIMGYDVQQTSPINKNEEFLKDANPLNKFIKKQKQVDHDMNEHF